MKALLIVDMLNDFVEKGSALEVPNTREIIPRIQILAGAMALDNEKVIYICDSHAEDDPEFIRMNWPPHAIKGSHGAAVVDQLFVKSDNTKIIEKSTYSGFYNTDLDSYLIEYGINELYITGCVTNICILYTVADAVQRGYRVTVYKDCVAGINPNDHRWALHEMEVVLGATVI